MRTKHKYRKVGIRKAAHTVSPVQNICEALKMSSSSQFVGLYFSITYQILSQMC